MKIAGVIENVDPKGILIVVDPITNKRYEVYLKKKYINTVKKLIGEKVVVHISGNRAIKISRVLKLKVYGMPYKKFRSYVGEIKRKYGPLDSILGIDIGVESIFDIVAILIWFVLFVFAFIYFIFILPIVYLVASIVTLGEVWRMRHKYRVVVPSKHIETITNNLPELIKKKAFVKGLPENLLTQDIKPLYKKLSKIYSIFDMGRALIGISLVLTVILYGYYWYIGSTLGFIEFAKVSGYWVYPVGAFTLGFLMIIIAGILRSLTKAK